MLQPVPRAKLDSVDLWTDVAGDVWQVEMADGAICAMGTSEIEASFERGEIGLHTRVQRPSGGDWRTLGEAAGVDTDSIRPVSSEVELIDVPRPPPLPQRVRAAEPDLTNEELAVLPRPNKAGPRLAVVAAVGLLLGGLVAWRTTPTHPAPLAVTTTIPAPTTPMAAAEAPLRPVAAAEPVSPAPPETSPAPEGNALPDPNDAPSSSPLAAKTAASLATAAKAAKGAKTKHAPAKTTWKHRAKRVKKKH